MEYHYADGRERKGPLDRDAVVSLIREGRLDSDTLVWHSGMAEWKPASEVEAFQRLFQENAVQPGPEEAVCAHSGKVLPKSEMVPYGDKWVSVEHKDAFIQGVMEGQGDRTPYVGFWWRVLGTIVDGAVLLVPQMVVQIPYMIASQGLEERIARSGGSDLSSTFTPGLILAWLLAVVGRTLIGAGYEIWMVGKYAGTVGKIAIGARIAAPDGSRISYKRAAGRWAAKSLLNGAIMSIAVGIPVGMLVFAVVVGTQSGDPSSTGLPLLIGAFVALVILYPLGLFPYWMCAFDKEKRTLHDRIAATRVLKKNA